MHEEIPVPRPIAICPYCGGSLTVRANEWNDWEEAGNDLWKAGGLEMDCETEPDIDSPEWRYWERQHSDMPYVYWLPVEEHIKEWVNRHYLFQEKEL